MWGDCRGAPALAVTGREPIGGDANGGEGKDREVVPGRGGTGGGPYPFGGDP